MVHMGTRCVTSAPGHVVCAQVQKIPRSSANLGKRTGVMTRKVMMKQRRTLMVIEYLMRNLHQQHTCGADAHWLEEGLRYPLEILFDPWSK